MSDQIRVCCVARDGSRCANKGNHAYPIWTGGIYELVARKKDGVRTWRRVGSFGGTRAGYLPSPKFVAELQEQAEYEWQPVTHGQVEERELVR